MSTAVAHPPTPMTLEEWADLDEGDPRELVDGFLEDAEVPDTAHEIIIPHLTRILGNWGATKGAFVLGSGAKYAVAARRGRMPDFSVFLPGDARPVGVQKLVRMPPSILCEVVTATARDERRDRVEKLAEYAAFGARWYWIVDPDLRSFQILERDAAGRYAFVVNATEGTIDPVPGCDGLVIDVSALWKVVDAFCAAATE